MPPTPYSTALQLTSVVVLWVALSVLQRDRRAPAGVWFAGLATSILVWCLGELLYQGGLVGDWIRDRITFAGILTLPPLWVGVAAHASGVEIARRIPWFPLALLLPSLFLYALLHLGPWSTVFIVSDGGLGEEGPLFPLWSLWAYGLTVTGVLFFALAAWRWPRRQGIGLRVVALAVGVGVPLVGNAVYITGIVPLREDPTPVLMGAAALALRRAVFGSRFFDVLPVDQRMILRDMPVGLIIADAHGAVVEISPAAERTLGVRRPQAVGRSLEALLGCLPAGVFLRESEIAGTGGARCVVVAEPDAPPTPLAKIA